MVARITLKGQERVIRNLERCKERKGDIIQKKMAQAVLETSTHIVDKYLSGRRGNAGLNRRTGKLARSIMRRATARGTGYLAVGTIGTDLIYARPNELGAVIKPKNASYLTIPLPPALTPAGAPRRTSARKWKDTIIFKSRSGNLIIAQVQGRKKSKKIIPLYVLKKSVRIPARPFLSTGFKDMTGRIKEILGQAVKVIVDYGNGH